MIATLFDEDLIIPALNGSGPLVSKGAPIQSHMAADRAVRTMHKTKVWVLKLVAKYGELPGSEINALFRGFVPVPDWVAHDTPRKRAGELATDGFLAARLEKSDGNHLDEAWYSLTDKGREVIA